MEVIYICELRDELSFERLLGPRASGVEVLLGALECAKYGLIMMHSGMTIGEIYIRRERHTFDGGACRQVIELASCHGLVDLTCDAESEDRLRRRGVIVVAVLGVDMSEISMQGCRYYIIVIKIHPAGVKLRREVLQNTL